MASVKTLKTFLLELDSDEAMFVAGALGAQMQSQVLPGKDSVYYLLSDALEDAGFSENSEIWGRSLELARGRRL